MSDASCTRSDQPASCLSKSGHRGNPPTRHAWVVTQAVAHHDKEYAPRDAAHTTHTRHNLERRVRSIQVKAKPSKMISVEAIEDGWGGNHQRWSG